MSKQNNIILYIGVILIIIGIFAVYSVSIHESFVLTLQNGDPSNYFYFLRHLRNIGVGLVLGYIFYKIPIARWKKNYLVIFILALVFQLSVLSPLGIELNGSRSWIYIPGLSTFQPVEIFKIGFVGLISGRLIRKKDILRDPKGFVGFCVVVGLCILLFLRIRDSGTILIIGLISLIMFWYAGGAKRFVLGLMLMGIVGGSIVATQFDYISERLQYFINPDSDTNGRGIGRQTKQALISVGAGGVLGKGYQKGLQKFGYIPEAQSDFIFASLAEEIGLMGNIVILAIFGRLIYAYITNSIYISDKYNKVLGAGIISLIIIQTFINIGVNINIVPLTGLTLPFVSYGGSGIIANIIQIVLLHKIINNQ